MSWRKTVQFWPEVLEKRWTGRVLSLCLTLTSALLSALRSVLNEATTKKRVWNNFSLVFKILYTLLLTVASGSDLLSVCEAPNAKLHPEKTQFKPPSAPRGFTHLEKGGDETSVSWWIQLSVRHKLIVQSGPFFFFTLSFQFIQPSPRRSSSMKIQQRGYMKPPCFNRVLRPNIPECAATSRPKIIKLVFWSVLVLIWREQRSQSNRNHRYEHGKRMSCDEAELQVSWSKHTNQKQIQQFKILYRKKIFRCCNSTEKILSYKLK